MQPSSKEVVLLQEKKGEKNFNFNPQKVPSSTRAQKKKKSNFLFLQQGVRSHFVPFHRPL